MNKLTYLVNHVVYWIGLVFITTVFGAMVVYLSSSEILAGVATAIYFWLGVLDRPRKNLQSS